jgi:HD-like signal output (HDOD) protein
MTPPTPSSPAAKEGYRRALLKIEQLHGNMGVLAVLGRMLRDPNNGLDEIATLLQTDSALGANIVRISNSVAYGIGTRSTNLPQALAKVGYNRVLALVGACLSQRLFMGDLRAYGISANEYWATSYFCAVFLEQEAPTLGVPPDDAYLVGLLHSIGRVVIDDLLARTKVEIYWDRSLPGEEWEEILVGFRHDEAGEHLLRQWKFSREIYERVGSQHSPRALEQDPLLLLLDFARACTELNHCRLADQPWRVPANHPWCSRPHTDPADLAAAVERVRLSSLQIGEVIGVP